jgi:hypothetical protein
MKESKRIEPVPLDDIEDRVRRYLEDKAESD